MKQIALSIEQMKHLQDLGLDTGDASMYWSLIKFYNSDEICSIKLCIMNADFIKNHECFIPTYTLQDILNKLPKRIKRKHYGAIRVGTLYSNLSHCIWYRTDDSNHKYMVQISKDNLLEAAYQMLLWCIENGYIKN